MRRLVALRPRPRPRPPPRRALSARGDKGPPRPRPRRSPLHDESWVRWTERQQGFRWSRLNTGQGRHVAGTWVLLGVFGAVCVYSVVVVVTGVPFRIYEIYDHTVNPREPDPTEEVRNPLYRDVGLKDGFRRYRPGGDWRYRFTDDELAELGRMGVDVDSGYGGPTEEQRQAILAKRRWAHMPDADKMAALQERVDSGLFSDDEMRELKEKIRDLNRNRDQLDAPTREALDRLNRLWRVADEDSG